MSSYSSMNPLISSLIDDGKMLPRLLRQAKRDEVNHDAVTQAIDNILKKLENPQLPPSCPKNIISKVLEKIQTTLQKFMEDHPENASKYEELAKKIKVKLCKQSSSIGSKSHSKVLRGHILSTIDFLEHEVDDMRDQLEELNVKEKKCLICFCLFSPGKEVKKREPIHLWISLELIDHPIEGGEMLAKLVDEGFIEQTIRNKKLCNRYKISEIIRSMISQALRIQIHEEGSLSIMSQQLLVLHQKQQHQPQQKELPHGKVSSSARMTRKQTLLQRMGSYFKESPDETDVLETLVLNIGENTLNARTSDRLSKRIKSRVKVLHLGSWDHDHKRYIMVEDMDAFKALIKPMGQVTFLSVEGVSGIVNLPDSVYKLDKLKVLDLRACPNLESLSDGIESLKCLTHLDLSECYLLDYIPKGIASLTKLKVLKGFVISPEDPQEVSNSINDRNSASFKDLSNLKKLIKLSIHSRRMNFPTSNDFSVLCEMKELANLKIVWVWSSVNSQCAIAPGRFPPSLKKLELQAAPEKILPKLLRLISEDTEIFLEKLYIRGSRVLDLGINTHYFVHVHRVCLRYLHKLHIDWHEFKKSFPRLTRLEVSGCPHLIFFPCGNGVWEETWNAHI